MTHPLIPPPRRNLFPCPGIKIMTGEHLSRRNRFIMACSLGLGIGVTLVPEWCAQCLLPSPAATPPCRAPPCCGAQPGV